MRRTLILAAAAAVAVFAFSAPGPAQARMATPGLNQVAPPAPLLDVHYRSYGHSHRRAHRRVYRPYRSYGYRYGYRPRCYTQRIVRWDGRVRYVRRCR